MGERKLRIAISGAKHGKWHAREIRRLERDLGLCELVAVCRATNGPSADFYDPMREEGLPSAAVPFFTNYANMLKEMAPDAVIITSPNRFHYDQAMRALEARCHVYLEKPSAWDPEDSLKQNEEAGEQLFTSAEASGMLLCGGTQLTTWFDRPGSGFYSIAPKLPESEIRMFEMQVGTASAKAGEELLVDMLPHAYGVLWKIAGTGSLAFDVPLHGQSDAFVQERQHSMIVRASYRRAEHKPVEMSLVLDAEYGRRFLGFAVNGIAARREVTNRPYTLWLANRTAREEVPDPLRLALFGFVAELAAPTFGRRLEKLAELRDAHAMLCDTLDAYRGRSVQDLSLSRSLSAAILQSS